jgi:hypothetical protein
VDQSRAILPRPAGGERVGVRGVLATAQHPQVGQKAAPHPFAAPRAAPDLSPQAGRGDLAAWSILSPACKRRRSHTLISATRY